MPRINTTVPTAYEVERLERIRLNQERLGERCFARHAARMRFWYTQDGVRHGCGRSCALLRLTRRLARDRLQPSWA